MQENWGGTSSQCRTGSDKITNVQITPVNLVDYSEEQFAEGHCLYQKICLDQIANLHIQHNVLEKRWLDKKIKSHWDPSKYLNIGSS